MTLTAQAINDAVTVIVTLAGVFGLNKGNLKRIADLVKGAAPEVATVGNDVIQEVKDLAQLPVAKTVEHHLKSQLADVQKAAQDSELGRLATVGLHAFGTALANLSDTQKAALVMFIKQHLPAGATVTDAEINDAITEAQKASDEVSLTPLFSLATSFTQAASAPATK